jgi:hypothetical protein
VWFIYSAKTGTTAKYGLLDTLGSATFAACLVYVFVSIFSSIRKPTTIKTMVVNKDTENAMIIEERERTSVGCSLILAYIMFGVFIGVVAWFVDTKKFPWLTEEVSIFLFLGISLIFAMLDIRAIHNEKHLRQHSKIAAREQTDDPLADAYVPMTDAECTAFNIDQIRESYRNNPEKRHEVEIELAISLGRKPTESELMIALDKKALEEAEKMAQMGT